MESGFYSLCYHYIRKENDDPLPRIFGTKINDFNDHVDMIKKEYNPISLEDAISFYYKKSDMNDIKNGLLMTFDDGLNDQFEAAKILSENNISAVFFIPTCTVVDNLPASPIILHYAIAIHGRKQFFNKLKKLIDEKYQITKTYFDRVFLTDDIQKSIEIIKNIFYYKLEPSLSRNFLIDIFYSMIQNEKISNEDINLSKNQIKELLNMGHFIGTHSHSHISLARKEINDDYMKNELLNPKSDLENIFNVNISCMSYPFGESRDCFNAQELFKKTKTYELAFTIEHKFNTENTSPLEIGRYMVDSRDSVDVLNKKINL